VRCGIYAAGSNGFDRRAVMRSTATSSTLAPRHTATAPRRAGRDSTMTPIANNAAEARAGTVRDGTRGYSTVPVPINTPVETCAMRTAPQNATGFCVAGWAKSQIRRSNQ